MVLTCVLSVYHKCLEVIQSTALLSVSVCLPAVLVTGLA